MPRCPEQYLRLALGAKLPVIFQDGQDFRVASSVASHEQFGQRGLVENLDVVSLGHPTYIGLVERALRNHPLSTNEATKSATVPITLTNQFFRLLGN